MFYLVPISGMGHRAAGSKAADRSHAYGKSEKAYHCGRGAQSAMDLREFLFRNACSI